MEPAAFVDFPQRFAGFSVFLQRFCEKRTLEVIPGDNWKEE